MEQLLVSGVQFVSEENFGRNAVHQTFYNLGLLMTFGTSLVTAATMLAPLVLGNDRRPYRIPC